MDVNRGPRFTAWGLLESLVENNMHSSTTIHPTAARLGSHLRFPARGPITWVSAAWQRWRTRRAAVALRRRALDLVATHPSLAADLAAAAGCTLDDLAS